MNVLLAAEEQYRRLLQRIASDPQALAEMAVGEVYYWQVLAAEEAVWEGLLQEVLLDCAWSRACEGSSAVEWAFVRLLQLDQRRFREQEQHMQAIGAHLLAAREVHAIAWAARAREQVTIKRYLLAEEVTACATPVK